MKKQKRRVVLSMDAAGQMVVTVVAGDGPTVSGDAAATAALAGVVEGVRKSMGTSSEVKP